MDELKALPSIAAWVRDASSAVALTGAGISTESGIPDFRSPGGVWSKYRTVYYDQFLASSEARDEYWRQKAEMHAEFAGAAPNAGHHVLAEWEAAGRLRGVLTQNIDGLHQLGGSRAVLELHGTAREAACLDCHWRAAVDPFVEQVLRSHSAPPCPQCQGRLKHATISFGQPLPSAVLQEAGEWVEQADLFLAIGSSLVVTPAADLPRLAKTHGARLVVINREPTPLDGIADAVVHGEMGATLQAIDRLMTQRN